MWISKRKKFYVSIPLFTYFQKNWRCVCEILRNQKIHRYIGIKEWIDNNQNMIILVKLSRILKQKINQMYESLSVKGCIISIKTGKNEKI